MKDSDPVGMKGFTLVEVVVVLTLVMLLTGLGLITYKDYYQSKVVQVAAESWAKEMELIVKKTESGALVKELADASGRCQGVFEATVINVSGSSQSYSVYLKCSQNNSPTFNYQLERFDPDKVVVFGADQEITILPLALGVKADTQVSVDFCLVKTGGNQCYYQVVFNKTGSIDVKKI